MAKITEMPSEAIINGLKGKLDFYYWMGIPCCRSWPKSPGHSRSQAVQAGWPAFTYASQSWNTLSPEIRELYIKMAAGTYLTGRDMFARSYMSGAFAYPTGSP